jgi:hypothetical protein
MLENLQIPVGRYHAGNVTAERGRSGSGSVRRGEEVYEKPIYENALISIQKTTDRDGQTNRSGGTADDGYYTTVVRQIPSVARAFGYLWPRKFQTRNDEFV